ncbi:DICT sensory domain-containing protein [Nocardioides daphniae]|uniref:HTH merR-type domain-containing protein n=1 Tax=Nocardioides daphniae TaxID=402297 RepID=A0ABQ1QGI5_9ACTN|nr:DICT sensory domain-containing protein [Nocardioides daphniae]GGD26962.1 hypothetical protein GCM10007231_27980 [Nocardioides daphniae]
MTDTFSIGTLAERTGLTANVLRTWENRYGFPAGSRAPSGHRRFTDADVAAVHEVLGAKESGVPLHLAIESVVQRSRRRAEESVHAMLVREFPELRPQRLSRATLIAASHALEDESLARADRPLVLGTFQHGHEFSRSRGRWEELGRTSLWSAVLADFSEGIPAAPQARPARCHLPKESPLRREWTVVTLSASFSAVLTAWEVPARSGPPVYESVVSLRRAPALAAAEAITASARAAGATPPPEVDELLGTYVVADTAATDADRVLLRVLGRVDDVRRGSDNAARER